MRNKLLSIVNAKYSVPTWLWNLSSTAFATIVLLYTIFSPDALDDFTSALVLNGTLWSAMLLIACILVGIGMARDRDGLVRLGAMVAFCLWIFGTIGFAGIGGANIIIFSAPIMVYYAYIYIASYLRKYPSRV